MPVVGFYDNAAQGGYLDNVEVTVTSASVETRNSEKTGNDYTALFMEWQVEGADESVSRVVLIGTPDKWGASEDKRDVIQADSGARWSRKSPIYQFLTDLINAGYTKDQIGSKPLADLVDGGVFHVLSRPNGKKYTGNDGKEHDSTEPYIDKVIKFPWENKSQPAAKGKTKAAAAAANSNGAVDDDAIKSQIADLVLTGIANGGDKGYTKARLSGDVIKHFKDDPKSRQRAVQLLKPDFLGTIDGVNFDGTNFTM